MTAASWPSSQPYHNWVLLASSRFEEKVEHPTNQEKKLQHLLMTLKYIETLHSQLFNQNKSIKSGKNIYIYIYNNTAFPNSNREIKNPELATQVKCLFNHNIALILHKTLFSCTYTTDSLIKEHESEVDSLINFTI